MNSEFETRWEKISEVQIPEIKHLGLQEAVLDREIWNKAPEVEPEYHAYLVRENTNEKIDLDREKMILGKGSDADYKLEGNKTISRRHAAFFYEDGQVYVEDLGSSNHTYIADCKVEGRQLLQDQDRIRIADEDFIFYDEIKG